VGHMAQRLGVCEVLALPSEPLVVSRLFERHIAHLSNDFQPFERATKGRA
jgi:hypothetical protein